MLWVGVASAAVLLGSWYYAAVKPPKPRLCGSPGGPPVTAPRIRLRDGRYLAYTETGVPKDQARFKIIFCHGFGGSRLDFLRASPELMEEIGIYMVAFDRPGYVESDPDPRRSPKSAALDIEELAEALELGPKFYFISFSLGGHAAWASLKYIPERLAGVALLAPVINCRWPGFPKDLSWEFYKKQSISGKGMRMGWFQLVCSVISAAASAGSSTMSSRQLGTTFQGYLGLLIVFLRIFCRNRSP